MENFCYGLYFMFLNNDLYFNNIFEDNGVGVVVMFLKGIKMYENIFKNNWGVVVYGMLLKEINDLEIKGNIF